MDSKLALRKVWLVYGTF